MEHQYYNIKGNMNLPENILEEQLEEIQNTLLKTISDTLGLKQDHIKVTIDPETGKTNCAIPMRLPQINAVENDSILNIADFVPDVNKNIIKNSKHLPRKLSSVLALLDDPQICRETNSILIDDYALSESILEPKIATFVVQTNDPNLAEEMQKLLKTEDFTENVNRRISENSEHLPERIRSVLEINDVKVNYLF